MNWIFLQMLLGIARGHFVEKHQDNSSFRLFVSRSSYSYRWNYGHFRAAARRKNSRYYYGLR